MRWQNGRRFSENIMRAISIARQGWKRDILERSDRGDIDVPRLIEGHYALQVFSSVTKSPKG
jgi:hypothetical protein